ncbi:MAG: MFS transporter [Actinomycetes bacterium]
MSTDPRFLPPSPFSRLVWAHAVGACGDAAIAASLAGSLFFSSPTNSSREKVLLYLLITMLPFAVVAPVLGPALDYRRSGRRVVLIGSMVGRALLAVLMARWVSQPAPAGLLVYPLAFGILVLAKGYTVTKSALVPALVGREDQLVRANSRLAIVSAIATTVGGGPAFLIQSVAGPEWSLRFAAVIFAVATVLAWKVPRVRIAQTATEARLEEQEMHQPSILLTGSAMAVIRGAVGFLAFFAAFSLKHDLFALGVAATMAVAGGFVGNVIGPWARRFLTIEQMMAVAVLATGGFVLLASLLGTTLGFALASLMVAIGAAAGRLSFDSMLQRDGPDAARGRAFAKFETRFQVAWVVGALLGIVPFAVGVGLMALAVVLLVAGVLYVGARRAARNLPMRSTLRPPVVDRAMGAAADNVRQRVRNRRSPRRSTSRSTPPGPSRTDPPASGSSRP